MMPRIFLPDQSTWETLVILPCFLAASMLQSPMATMPRKLWYLASPIFLPLPSRITSYNVCYTKLLRSLERLFARPLLELRELLLQRPGIGPETADSILLYAAELPSFVVDAYTSYNFV